MPVGQDGILLADRQSASSLPSYPTKEPLQAVVARVTRSRRLSQCLKALEKSHSETLSRSGALLCNIEQDLAKVGALRESEQSGASRAFYCL